MIVKLNVSELLVLNSVDPDVDDVRSCGGQGVERCCGPPIGYSRPRPHSGRSGLAAAGPAGRHGRIQPSTGNTPGRQPGFDSHLCYVSMLLSFNPLFTALRITHR